MNLTGAIKDFPAKILQVMQLAEILRSHPSERDYAMMAEKIMDSSHDEVLAYSTVWDAVEGHKSVPESILATVRHEFETEGIDWNSIQSRLKPNVPNVTLKFKVLDYLSLKDGLRTTQEPEDIAIEGTVQIQSHSTGRCLAIADETEVCSKVRSQEFQLVKSEERVFNIVSVKYNACLSVSEGSESNGTSIVALPCSSEDKGRGLKFFKSSKEAGLHKILLLQSGKCIEEVQFKESSSNLLI